MTVISHKQFAEQVNAEGGSSRSMYHSQPAESPGVMVSHYGKEKITDAPLTYEQAKAFKRDNSAVATGADYHGAWQSGNKIFQDVSSKHLGLDSARKSGESNAQIAGYDLGGTDARRPEGGEVFFGRGVPGIETNSEFKGSDKETSIPERMSPKPRAQEFAEQAHISRGAQRMTRQGQKRKVSINEVYATIAKNRRNRGV